MRSSSFLAILVGGAAGVLLAILLLSVLGPLVQRRTARNPDRANRARAANNPPADAPSANAPAVNGPAAPAPVSAQLQGLRQIVAEEAGKIPGRPSIHFRMRGVGEAGHEATAPKPAASVIKLPLMVVVEHAWRSGTLQRTGPDEARMRKMMTVSDNPAADALIERVGMSQVNTWLEEHGYTGTRLKHTMAGPRPEGHNTVTAAEMTRMLLDIAEGRVIDEAASMEMRRILRASERRTRIPAGLPAGVVSGNKTGTLNGIVNDVAFVELPDGRVYALAVLVDQAGADETTSKAIARLSRRLYERVTNTVVPEVTITPESR